MSKAILGKKLGMTQVFTAEGKIGMPVHLRHSKLNSLRGMTIRSTKMFQSPNLWLPVI